MKPTYWEALCEKAHGIVEETITGLPEEIRSQAKAVPCLFEKYCAEDPDILGIYAPFAAGEPAAANGPIILYLLALEEFCAEEDTDFDDEVRITFLHELGHHLGWEEGDLEARGLA